MNPQCKQGIPTPIRATVHGLAQASITAALVAMLIGMPARAQKLCSITVKSTPGAPADNACLDLVALTQNGGPAIQVGNNVTRISNAGLKLCANAFTVSSGGSADVVFIYDNSGSMWSHRATIDSVAKDTTFWDATNCNVAGVGTVAYAVQDTAFARPPQSLVKNIPLLSSTANCREYAGDPYNARGVVIRNAIRYLAQKAPTSTSGSVGFAESAQFPQPPLQLNLLANVTQVTGMVRLDSVPTTNYEPPLRLAKTWLNDATLIKNTRQAIVFISDGNASDGNASVNLVDSNMPPIYSIFLGKKPTADTARLKQLSDLTQGLFFRVDPTKPAGIQVVMDSIIRKITETSIPKTIVITNTTNGQTSVAGPMSIGAGGNLVIALDSIIALAQGKNDFSVTVTKSDGTVGKYEFTIKADGAEATASTSELTCYDPPVLTLVNTQGKADSAYPAGSNAYQVKLTVPGTDLGKATVTSISLDSTKGPAWGDSETTVMTGTGGTFQGPLTLNGSATSITDNNGKLEGDAIGKVILSWVHPRDPRQTATYALPGARIPVIPPFIEVERVRDVTRGETSGGTIQDPVVIYGGAGLDHSKPDSLRLTYGVCLSNCTGEAIRLADPTKIPGFVFKTASPFSYTVKVFDHLGNFVNEAQGTVDAAKWQAMPRTGDSVAVVMSVLPVAKNGAKVGSGVYLLRAVINSQPGSTHDAKGNEKTVAANSRSFLNRFGYIRSQR